LKLLDERADRHWHRRDRTSARATCQSPRPSPRPGHGHRSSAKPAILPDFVCFTDNLYKYKIICVSRLLPELFYEAARRYIGTSSLKPDKQFLFIGKPLPSTQNFVVCSADCISQILFYHKKLKIKMSPNKQQSRGSKDSR